MSEIKVVQLDPRPFIGVRRELPVTELATFFAEALPKVFAWLEAKGIQPASMPSAMWLSMDMETGVADCHAGCFVSEAIEGEDDITPGSSVGGECLTVTHRGPYTTVGKSWMSLYGKAKELGKEPGPGWEIYANDPHEVAPEDIETQIHLPIS